MPKQTAYAKTGKSHRLRILQVPPILRIHTQRSKEENNCTEEKKRLKNEIVCCGSICFSFLHSFCLYLYNLSLSVSRIAFYFFPSFIRRLQTNLILMAADAVAAFALPW